jgi:hypothetical protein
MVGTKGAAHRVDLVFRGEMQGVVAAGHLLGVAAAAACRHGVRMPWFADQAGMGLLLGARLLLAPVAGGAGELVGAIKLQGVAVPATIAGRGLGLLGRGGRGLFFLLVLGAAAGKKQGKDGGDKAELSSLPAQTNPIPLKGILKRVPLLYKKSLFHGVCAEGKGLAAVEVGAGCRLKKILKIDEQCKEMGGQAEARAK